MARMSQERIDACNLATRNAKQILKPGDKIRASRCGGIKATYKFSHWGGDWIISASDVSDIAAIHIDKLNGQPIDFSSCDISEFKAERN